MENVNFGRMKILVNSSEAYPGFFNPFKNKTVNKFLAKRFFPVCIFLCLVGRRLNFVTGVGSNHEFVCFLKQPFFTIAF